MTEQGARTGKRSLVTSIRRLRAVGCGEDAEDARRLLEVLREETGAPRVSLLTSTMAAGLAAGSVHVGELRPGSIAFEIRQPSPSNSRIAFDLARPYDSEDAEIAEVLALEVLALVDNAAMAREARQTA